MAEAIDCALTHFERRHDMSHWLPSRASHHSWFFSKVSKLAHKISISNSFDVILHVLCLRISWLLPRRRAIALISNATNLHKNHFYVTSVFIIFRVCVCVFVLFKCSLYHFHFVSFCIYHEPIQAKTRTIFR